MHSLVSVCIAYIYYNPRPEKKFFRVLNMLLRGIDDIDSCRVTIELSWILEAKDKQQAYNRARRHIRDKCQKHALVVSHLEKLTTCGFTMINILKHAGMLY